MIVTQLQIAVTPLQQSAKAVRLALMGEHGTVRLVGKSAEAPTASAQHDAPAIQDENSQAESAETRLLKEILVAMERLNVSMTKMERSLSEMLNQGVKVKWLK